MPLDLAVGRAAQDAAGGLYLDPGHLKPYQVADIAAARRLGRAVLGWDTGMGKSRGALALACALLDDGEIDTVLLVAEQNKLAEWSDDIEQLTAASFRLHHGPGRGAALERLGVPQILITTYETSGADAVELDFDGESDGPLTAALADSRVLVVYDEIPKLAVAASGLYRAHRYLLARLPGARVVGLTATPLTRDWNSVYSVFVKICPQVLPNRREFEQRCVFLQDKYQTIWQADPVIEEHLLTPIRPFLLRRRKSDPEVAPLFPVTHEHVVHTTMGPDQAEVYAAVEALGHAGDEVPGLWSVLRLLAAYPAAVADMAAGDGSALARDVAKAVGADRLRAIRPGKLDALLELAAPIAAAGDKGVVFSFFGPSVLPLLAADCAPLGAKVFLHHGGLSAKARNAAISGFRGHDGPALLLTSDAGSRGINLPEARHVIEYEGALTYMVGSQRRNRVHRLDSPHPEVWSHTLVADGTVEEPIAEVMLRRNTRTDTLLGDDVDGGDGFTSAEDRRALMGLWKARPVAV